MASIFKAYDIRGIVGQELSEDLAFRIGCAFATFLKCKKVVVGQDMRQHSTPLFRALSCGLTRLGVDVIRLGLCSTPMSYYANGKLGADGSIMITASHNSAEWNGFKLCREQAIPISEATGIKEIERLALSGQFALPAPRPGQVSDYDIFPEYTAHVARQAALQRPLNIAVDFANAMGIIEAKALPDQIVIDPLYDTFDGSFPNHEANPLKTETLRALQAKVRSGKYAFGAAFDGDADRVGFVDETGQSVPMDMITALIAQSILKKNPGTVFYDLRSSWAVREVILENGGKPRLSRVGHAFIKQQMREAQALFAGELSGHYYFQDNYYTESSAMAVLSIANLLSGSSQTLSQLIKPLQRYAKSAEINFEVHDQPALLSRLRERYRGGKILELDGLSVEFPDWWFNVRASNTEPLVRLNLEAKSPALLAQHQAELENIIRAG